MMVNVFIESAIGKNWIMMVQMGTIMMTRI